MSCSLYGLCRARDDAKDAGDRKKECCRKFRMLGEQCEFSDLYLTAVFIAVISVVCTDPTDPKLIQLLQRYKPVSSLSSSKK